MYFECKFSALCAATSASSALPSGVNNKTATTTELPPPPVTSLHGFIIRNSPVGFSFCQRLVKEHNINLFLGEKDGDLEKERGGSYTNNISGKFNWHIELDCRACP